MIFSKTRGLRRQNVKYACRTMKYGAVLLLSFSLFSCNKSVDYPSSIASSTPEPPPSSSRSQLIPEDFPVNEADAARFLMRATFGPTQNAIDELMEDGYSIWLQRQLSMPVSTYVSEMLPDPSSRSDTTIAEGSGILFWRKAILADDELRQRVAFALSEIMVVSVFNGDGTDHGWGNHHFVVGGGLNGGNIEGLMPEASFDHDQDSDRGRLIPTTSVEQYAASMGRWFGLSDVELYEALPGLNNFDINRLNGLFL